MDILYNRVLLDKAFELEGDFADNTFNAAAMTDGKRVSVILLNRAEEAVDVEVDLPVEGAYEYEKTVLSYAKNTCNTADAPETIKVPDPELCAGEGKLTLTLAANSIVTVITK